MTQADTRRICLKKTNRHNLINSISDLLQIFSTFGGALCNTDVLVSLLQKVDVRRHQLKNEKHLCSTVSRKSGEVLKGTGMCGKRTLVKCMVPH